MSRVPTRNPACVVAGATGLVGRAVVDELLAAGRPVLALVRRPVPEWSGRPGLQTATVRFDAPALGLPAWPDGCDAICALGTTIGAAGSQAAFRAVDFDAVLAFARAAQAAGAQRLAVVSALGADAGSRVFYNRVKGEMEAALTAMRWPRLVIARPSLLAGEREALGQPARLGERLALALATPLAWALPLGMRPIKAQVVARAMLKAMQQPGQAVEVLESAALQRLGA